MKNLIFRVTPRGVPKVSSALSATELDIVSTLTTEKALRVTLRHLK